MTKKSCGSCGGDTAWSCDTAHLLHWQPVPGGPPQSQVEQSLSRAVAGLMQAWAGFCCTLLPQLHRKLVHTSKYTVLPSAEVRDSESLSILM